MFHRKGKHPVRWFVPMVLLLVLVILVQLGWMAARAFRSAGSGPLSSEQIAELRSAYPVMPHKYGELVEARPFMLDKDLGIASNAFLEVEVVERLDDSQRGADLDPYDGVDPAVREEKEKNLGFTLPMIQVRQRYEVYRLRVRDILFQGNTSHSALDPSLALVAGDVFTAWAMVSNENIVECPLPDMRQGMRFFVPLSIGEPVGLCECDYLFRNLGMYYVVDGTHVLSVYEEREPCRLSGTPIEDFRRIIREIRGDGPAIADGAGS